MISYKVRGVLATLGLSKSIRIQQHPKIAVIFTVAIAIRKFQKFESDKFKKSLSYDFDKQAALEELGRLFDADPVFFVKEFIKLAYFIRKFNLTVDDLSSLDRREPDRHAIALGVYEHLKIGCRPNEVADNKLLYFLCLTLKYLIRNSSCGSTVNLLEISSIVQLIGTCVSPLIQSELVALLACYMEKSSEVLSSDQLTELETLVLNLPELTLDVKVSFLSRLENTKAVKQLTPEPEQGHEDVKFRKSLTVRKVKKNQQLLSKTIQTVKSKQETKQSEEADFRLLNLTHCLSRNRRANYNIVLEKVEPSESKDGSDRSMLRTTWAETINLSSIVALGQALKDDDKDNYLPEKFLGDHYFTGTFFDADATKMYSFFINRTCASIFCSVSRKQQLNDKAIDKLLKCITTFERLVSVLDLENDYVKMFVDTTRKRYWELKEITSPHVVVELVKEIMRKTTEEYLSRGWIYNSTGVRQRSFVRAEVMKIIDNAVNQVRLDAVKALHNCAVRDRNILTQERVEKIRCLLITEDEGHCDTTFQSFVYKLIELAETRVDFDYAKIFQTYLDQLPGESTENIERILRFFNNQAKDLRRSGELFSDEVISKLIGLVGASSHFSSKLQLDLVEVINTYLEHEHNKSISDSNLSRLLTAVFESDDTRLIHLVLTSLLLSTNKTRSMPQSLIDILLKNFDLLSHVDECTSYIVFILSRVLCYDDVHSRQCFLDDPNHVEKISAKLQCDHVVKLHEDDTIDNQRVGFEKRSDNSHCSPSNQISVLAAKIILKSIENKVIVNTATVDNLLSVLSSNDADDKQTKILASKCLYGLTKCTSFKGDDLNQMLDLIDSPIYDVSVYVKAAYLKGCVQMAYSPGHSRLDPIHLENISALYVPESLMLGQRDYESEINKSLFKTLLYEARKREFNDNNLFTLFDSLLNMSSKYAADILEILVAYTFKYVIPAATVGTLENLLSISCYFEKALLVLQNTILGGQSFITSKTLSVFIDHLYLSQNRRVRFCSFKLLEHASRNQELADEIFCKFELAKAGYMLQSHTEQASANDRRTVIKFIQSITDKGIYLPVDTQEALEKLITDSDVLRIFANVSKNKQIIHVNLFAALIEMFEPTKKSAEISILLINIFQNAARNNQPLPNHLLDKLEVALQRRDLEQSALPVFIYLAQKGEKLSQHVNHKLLDRLLTEQEPVLKQELLSSFGSLIDANQQDIKLYQMKLNRVLIREIKSDNFNIQKLCITALHKLMTVSKRIDDELLVELVDIGTSSNCSNTIRQEIAKLFDGIEDSFNALILKKCYRERVKLANLNCESSEDLLHCLSQYTHLDGVFLEQNYKQLKDIFDNGSTDLQEAALNILHKVKCKSEITDELLESIANLYERTMSDRLKSSCVQLFSQIVESGKTLPSRAGEMWGEELYRNENIRKFFQSQICRELKQEFQLSETMMLDLLQMIQASEKIHHVKDLADFVQLLVSEMSAFFENQSFVLLMEQCLLKSRILETTLPCYCRIIKERRCCKVKECLQMLVEHFSSSEHNENRFSDLGNQLFESLYYTSLFTQLPDVCMKFVINNLDNSNEVIRGYSFAILRITNENHVTLNIFEEWCDLMLESLAQNVNVEIEKSEDCLELLEIITSVKFLDLEVFRNIRREMWKRELLVSSIFESHRVFQMDQINFYTYWFTIEDKFGYDYTCKILKIIQMSNFDSFAQIIEIIVMMSELHFDEVTQMLSVYGPEPFEAFKHEWCLKKLQKHTSSTLEGININFFNKLVKKVCSSFDVKFIIRIFGCITSLDNVAAFEDLIDFCSREKIKLDDMDFANVQLNDLRRLIEAKHLCKCSKSQPKSEVEEARFMQIVQTLKNEGYNFVHLRQLVTSFNLPEPFGQFQHLLHLLNIIKDYHLSSTSNFEKCKQILSESRSFQEMIKRLNKLAIENHFQLEGKVKDLNEILAELGETNDTEHELAGFIKAGSLNITEEIFVKESAKLNWNEKEIHTWAMKVKAEKREFSDYEAVAVILRANFLITGHTLTDTQILCSLIALRRGEHLKGKLLQVATGEGKSTIICILAIINGLRGKKVDVVTSSPVLAERDAKQKAKLYRMFCLTCSDNSDKTLYVKGAKDCYKADIVYGEMSQFQFDILRDNYSKLGTLCNRKCTVAIMDEVDSMLIDDGSKIARLSTIVPGMDHLHAIYVFLWQRLTSIKEKFIMFKNTLYFVDGKVGFEDGKITLEIVNDTNDIVKIPDLENYLISAHDISRVAEVVGDDIDGYLRKSLESYLDSQIKGNKIYIPRNFAEFVKRQKPKWITNAVEALNYQENVHYVVKDGEIKPVDYYSTGIVQSSTSWSDGLHQFLQLKHNLKMTSETLTTNFLSNIGFINRYEQLCGLTATLGSETARSVLKDVYKVELINIPQRRQKQFLELDPVVVQGEANWLKEIASNIMLEVQKERGILVICETIEHANRISEMLKNKVRSSAVKLYTMNDMNQEKNVEKILPGEVIIATNLAGRGTDIHTDEIEVSGGLHVILTFMPTNQRVEDQAFGRTARQGRRGTGLMILNAHSLVGYMNTSMKTGTKKERDALESSHLIKFKEKELKLIQMKDRLFGRFCAFLNDEVRLKIRQGHNSYAKQVISWFTEVVPTTYESNVLAAIEEQWAGFLTTLDDGITKCEDAENKCSALIDQLRNDFVSDNLIKNPYYYICIANDILVHQWSIAEWVKTDSSKLKRALGYFERAVKLEENKKDDKVDQKLPKGTTDQSDADDVIANPGKKASKQDSEVVCGTGAAHLGVAWCSILLKEKNYKERALTSFKTALECLSNEMSLLNATQLLLQQTQTGFVNSDLYKQLNIRATILGSYISGINGCILAIKKSKRLIDVVVVEKHKKGNDILETIKHFNEEERSEEQKTIFRNVDLKLNDKKRYSLTFNHLTTREDSGTIDQALVTLQSAFDKSILEMAASEMSRLRKLQHDAKSKVWSNNDCCLDSEYSDIQIKLRQVDLGDVNRALFKPDKEFKELTRETALATLKEQRSYSHALGFSSSCQTNLTISSNDKRALNMTYEDMEINELIKIVDSQPISDAALRFDVVIKEGNKNELQPVLLSKNHDNRSVAFCVDFENLSREAALAKLSSVKAESFNIEFVLNKSRLLKLIEHKSLKYGILYDNKKHLFEKVTIKEMLKRVGQLEMDESPCYVKFEKLGIGQAKYLVKSCHEHVLFAVSFCHVDLYGSDLNDGQVSFSFIKLNQDSAKIVINLLRRKNFDFCLEFADLPDTVVKHVLKNASLEQEEIEVRKVKHLSDLFMKSATPTLELNEFTAKGIEYILEISENLFVPWRSVAAIAALGIGQGLLGGFLIITGFGSTVGMGLVTEGIADVFNAYRAYSTRQFSWSDYCMQKAVSIALSAVSMGISKWTESLQNAVKGVQTVTTGVGIEVLEQGATQLVTNRQTLETMRENLKSLAWKFVVTKFTEAAARECLNTGIKCLSNLSFDLLRSKIVESVQSKVTLSFHNTELKSLLRKMYAFDLATNSNKLHPRVEQIVSETINPRHDLVRRLWESIALPLIKGVLSDPSRCGSNASTTIRILGTLNGLYQVKELTDNVVATLTKRLRLVDRNSMTISLLLHGYLKIKKDNAVAVVNKLKEMEIFDEYDNFNISESDVSSDDTELKRRMKQLSLWDKNKTTVLQDLIGHINPVEMEDDFGKSVHFIQLFYKSYVEIEFSSFSMMIKSVSDQITEQLIRIIDSQLIQPWSTLVVSNLVDSVSKRVQNYLVDEKQNSYSHDAQQKKYEELLEKETPTQEEMEFIANYGKFRTFAEQINFNVMDYCDAYVQCEMVYYAGKSEKAGFAHSVDRDVKQAADDVRNGGPVNFAVMIATAKKNGVNLKIVDNENYERTQDDVNNNVEIIYVQHGPNNEIGHAYYMDSGGRFVETQSQGYDCFFVAFSNILEKNGIIKSVADLRADAAMQMESNSTNFSKVVDAERWMRKTHPGSANALLFTAGLYRDDTGKLIVEEEDIDYVLKSINDDKRGRKYAYCFKNKVIKAPDDSCDPATQLACHHLAPNSTVVDIVTKLCGSEGEDRETFRLALQEHINQPHIKEVLDDPRLPIGNKPAENQKQRDEHGMIIHGSVSWNPNNIVRGPIPEQRGDDPGSSVETKILNQQTDAYKSVFSCVVCTCNSPITSFNAFTSLPATTPVTWTKLQNDNGDKYVVEEPQQNNIPSENPNNPDGQQLPPHDFSSKFL